MNLLRQSKDNQNPIDVLWKMIETMEKEQAGDST